LRVFTTVGFPLLQFNAARRQCVATREVPQGDDDILEVPGRTRGNGLGLSIVTALTSLHGGAVFL
jgi:hypothetical protein